MNGKTAFRMEYGLSEHLGCHLSSEGIAMSPANIQSIENWVELRISPAKTQSIEDWAEPRSVENVQQFSSCANLYREVAGTDSANGGLGCAEKRQERSVVLGLREHVGPAEIQSIEDWAEPRSAENLQQFSSYANLYREVAGKDSANR
jgi:hypothetical protein